MKHVTNLLLMLFIMALIGYLLTIFIEPTPSKELKQAAVIFLFFFFTIGSLVYGLYQDNKD